VRGSQATRAFAPDHSALPRAGRELGQPVIIVGDMGRYSFVMLRRETTTRETFGSSCHCVDRLMSRSQAMRQARGRDRNPELAERGLKVRARRRADIAEEMPAAYKDVAEVVEVLEGAGLARTVARLKAFAVIKG
jgi:tRNA-splicing ligase RtcB (3'-phosphate/5'-hydroxy nucleic acid ligase)